MAYIAVNVGLVGFVFYKQQGHYRESLSLEKEKLHLKSQIEPLWLMITQQQGGTETATPLYMVVTKNDSKNGVNIMNIVVVILKKKLVILLTMK